MTHNACPALVSQTRLRPILKTIFLRFHCWIQTLHLPSPYSTSCLNLSPSAVDPPSIYFDLAFNLLLCIVLILLFFPVLAVCKKNYHISTELFLRGNHGFSFLKLTESFGYLCFCAPFCNRGVFLIYCYLC